MWLGIDGEGVGRFPHRYIQLCISSADGQVRNFIEDVNGLATHECLDFLLRYGKSGRLAGYYLTYDWSKILADLPDAAIYTLLRPERRINESRGFQPIDWRGYKLHYLAGMMRIQRGRQSVTVWDVGKYYQTSFVAALESSGLAPTELITRMKEERGTESWTDDRLDMMRDYCLEECQLLARLAEQLERQHEAIGLRPRAWHGPGSTAGTLLDEHHIRMYMPQSTPEEIRHAALAAYFGGRFEHSLVGCMPDCTAYDVRSAYPAAATTLPCLAHSRWVRQRRAPKDGETALVRYQVTDIGDRVWGPLPCRLADDSIVWSRGGHSGWCWSVEFEPAQRHWRGVEYAGECYVLRRDCSCEPFAFLRELYDWRVSRPENKQIVKLAMNSVYGKLAQTVGGGRYSSRVWAGIITASCRARMLELIARHGDESRLAAIATDGAYSAERFDIDSPTLGGWEVKAKGDMTFLRPGIYWPDADVKALRARGVGRKHMISQLDRALEGVRQNAEKVTLGTTPHFGTARECVYRTQRGVIKRSKAYGEWLDAPVSLSLKPGPKRDVDWRPPKLDGIESKPYNRKTASPDAKTLELLRSLLEVR